ncbi:MAG: alpha/beta hydrolase [archaeon]|nr:alpha/beta hydrolase [archaeon]
MPKIKLNGIETYYEVQGTGQPLVLVHGAVGTHDIWKPQIKHFSKKYKVITYDLRGHGKTEKGEGEYSIGLFADDLNELLKKLNIEKPIICGLSLGGMIAQAYAVKHPDNVKSLVLSDTWASSSLTMRDKIVKHVLPETVMKLMIRHLRPETYLKIITFFFKKRGVKLKKGMTDRWEGTEKEEIVKTLGAVYRFSVQELEKIVAPTLIIVGELERKNVFKHAKYMSRQIENSWIETVPGAIHISNLENVEYFDELLELIAPL